MDPRSPKRATVPAERARLKASEPDELLSSWAMIEHVWDATVRRARELPGARVHERVENEWSFVETQRHLVMATDCWLRRMVKGMEHPYHPWGLAGPWLTDPRRFGLDPDADPSLSQVLEVRSGRMNEVREVLKAMTRQELGRTCVPPPTPGHPRKPRTVLECLHVVLKEEYEHHRYAVRDLAVIEERAP